MNPKRIKGFTGFLTVTPPAARADPLEYCCFQFPQNFLEQPALHRTPFAVGFVLAADGVSGTGSSTIGSSPASWMRTFL